MDANKQKILERVAKCFALAKDAGAAPNEAETALRQARKLMQQHNLQEVEVHAVLACEASVATGTRRTPAHWLHQLAQVCSAAFDCEHLAYFDQRLGWAFKFVGVGVGPELASYAYSALHQQLLAARKIFVQSQSRCKLATKRRRGQIFAEGWIEAVRVKVQAFAQGKPEETQRVIDAYLAITHPNLKTFELEYIEAKGHDTRSRLQGFQQGKTAQLHHGVSRQGGLALGDRV
ncbi:DUF2786 domain-containing protein [Pseudomonas sp. EpS/L25]|uniref:DUF2786 domain-containing protein n=1 Tax=Pseudomonas sp. EpS/L25 TaxID=1749078 RepID=UPI0007441AB3|nr:DUF2786 domain-containing protein [Pseudomonas sp. EpS/L25]KUM43698.1 hypothetical protein AR540_18100 [Pseudomonas sp. EpS/L25]